MGVFEILRVLVFETVELRFVSFRNLGVFTLKFIIDFSLDSGIFTSSSLHVSSESLVEGTKFSFVGSTSLSVLGLYGLIPVTSVFSLGIPVSFLEASVHSDVLLFPRGHDLLLTGTVASVDFLVSKLEGSFECFPLLSLPKVLLVPVFVKLSKLSSELLLLLEGDFLGGLRVKFRDVSSWNSSLGLLPLLLDLRDGDSGSSLAVFLDLSSSICELSRFLIESLQPSGNLLNLLSESLVSSLDSLLGSSVVADFIEAEFGFLAELSSVDSSELGTYNLSSVGSLVLDAVLVTGSLGESGTLSVLEEWYNFTVLLKEIDFLSISSGNSLDKLSDLVGGLFSNIGVYLNNLLS